MKVAVTIVPLTADVETDFVSAISVTTTTMENVWKHLAAESMTVRLPNMDGVGQMMCAFAIPDISASTAVGVQYVPTIVLVMANAQTMIGASVIQIGPEKDVTYPRVQIFRNVTVMVIVPPMVRVIVCPVGPEVAVVSRLVSKSITAGLEESA